MEIRNLGRSGLRVSSIGLGCNNFGGRIDLEATRKVVYRAIDLGITLLDTADVYGERGGSETCLGEVLGDRRKGHRAGDQVRNADGRRRGPEGRIPPLHHARRGGQPAPPQDGLDRPLPATPTRSADAHGGDVTRTRRPRASGEGSLHRMLEPAGVAGGRSAVDREARRPEPVRVVSGRILPSRSRRGRARSWRQQCGNTAWGCCRSSPLPVAC